MGDRSVFDGPSPVSSPSGRPVSSFKVILVGDVGVGKSALFLRTRDTNHNVHRDLSSSTIGLDSCTRTLSTRSGSVALTLWDTAGVEKFRTLTRNYYRNTDAALLVFSLDDPASLFHLTTWESDVVESAPEAMKFLVGNKSDLERAVTSMSVQNFIAAHNCQAAFLTSAKTGNGVEAALVAICEYLMTKHKHHRATENQKNLWMLGSGPYVHGCDEHESNSKCCG